MKAFFVVIFVVVGSAYCRSLPAKPQPLADIESLNGNPVPLVRKARQFGKTLQAHHLSDECISIYVF